MKSACRIVALAVVLALPQTVLAADSAPPKAGLGNPFFAMDTGTKDAKHQTFDAQARMIKELGYAGYGPGGLTGVPEMLKAMDAHGLKLFALYMGANIDADQPAFDPKLKEVIQLLKGRGTHVWLFVQSKKLKPSDPAGDERAVQVIREIADLAQASDLKVALYPHTWFWFERVEDGVRLAKKIDRKNVGVTFNLCHWLKVGDEKNMDLRLKEALPHLFLVTINGADREGDWNRLIQPLGRGEFDVYNFLRQLKKLGYTGPIGLQHYGIQGDAQENLKRSMDAWKKFSARMAEEKE
jgi:sugar phosphate isomerase/epimerase